MAITVETSKPAQLLAAIKKAIDDGQIDTWGYDKDGDFTHTPEQWSKKAWLRPVIQNGVLQLGLFGQKDVVMKKIIYGVYHGRFIEMLVTHFGDSLLSATASATKVAPPDNFTGTPV